MTVSLRLVYLQFLYVSFAFRCVSGAPCDNNAGYCDMLDKCRKVDAEGPLSRLKNWLFNPQTFDTILDWMKKYWWACILIGLGAILLMAGWCAFLFHVIVSK